MASELWGARDDVTINRSARDLNVGGAADTVGSRDWYRGASRAAPL